MKKIFIVIVLLTVISNYSMATTEDNLHWFKDAKFGLFIHWGLYSQTAGEWKGHPPVCWIYNIVIIRILAG